MKKILSVVLVLIAIGHVSAIAAEPNTPMGISVIKNGALVKLFYRGEQSGKVKVTIYNDNGDLVFTETMKHIEHFMRPYNFEALPYGEYTIELSDETGKRYEKISHRAADASRTAHVTRLKGVESKFLLTVPNKGKDKLKIRIYDRDDRLVFEEDRLIEGDFAKVYNLEEIAGDHTFEIVDQEGRRNRIVK